MQARAKPAQLPVVLRGPPIEVAQLAHSWRTGTEPSSAGSLSVDARQAYATQNGREWPKIDRYQEEMTDWHNRHLERFGDPAPGEDFDPYW